MRAAVVLSPLGGCRYNPRHHAVAGDWLPLIDPLTTEHSSWTLRQRIGSASLFALAAIAAGAVGLSEPSLWVDEAYTGFFVRMDWADMARAVRIDGVNPPFFYAYTKLFVNALGSGEAALRLPSLLAHAVGVGASFWLGQQLAGKIGALTSSWIWAFHPMLLWFARDARPYALVSALAALSLALFLHAKERSELQPHHLLPAILTVSLGLLTHYFFLLFVAVTGLLALRELRRSPRFFRAWTLVLILSLLPLMGWIWWFLQLEFPSFGIGWIAAPGPLDPLATLWNLVSGYGGAFGLGTSIFGAAALLLLVQGLETAWRTALVGLLLPVAAVWFLSQLRPVYVDRYFAVLLPFVAAIAAIGGHDLWSWIQTRLDAGELPARTLLLIAAAIPALAGVLAVHHHPAYEKEDWRSLTSWLNSAPASAALYLSEAEAQLPLDYYELKRDIGGMIAADSCEAECLWVMRQPYTATHAFTQAVPDPTRPDWRPQLPAGCVIHARAPLPTSGLSGWHLRCDS